MQIVVASKFDNRLKEFVERWEVDRYLSAAGYLHPSVKPFFVALPKVPDLLPCCFFSANHSLGVLGLKDIHAGSRIAHCRPPVSGVASFKRWMGLSCHTCTKFLVVLMKRDLDHVLALDLLRGARCFGRLKVHITSVGVEVFLRLDIKARSVCCRYLEEELARRYRDAAPATLSILQERCKAVLRDLADANESLASSKDVAHSRTEGTW